MLAIYIADTQMALELVRRILMKKYNEKFHESQKYHKKAEMP